jgi:hypothetical protein
MSVWTGGDEDKGTSPHPRSRRLALVAAWLPPALGRLGTGGRFAATDRRYALEAIVDVYRYVETA